MSEQSFAGRVALVTGAGRGIGFAIARELGRQGARIGLNDLHGTESERAAGALRELGICAMALPGDVSTAAVANSIVNQVVATFGRLDVLVNNAGVLRPTPTEAISDAEWDLVLHGNLRSAFLCCRAAIPLLRKSATACIVNISSSAGKSVSTIGGSHYTAAKAGLLGLTRHLARELAVDGIRVNAVCPGLISTEMVRSTITANRIDEYAASFPARRLGRPEEVAELVAFMASDRASYVTGASYDINGGDLTI